jgi:hypothetical protein
MADPHETSPEPENTQPGTEQDATEYEKISAHITDIGIIGELGPELRPDSFNTVWSGSIGIDSRKSVDPGLEAQVNEILGNAEELEENYYLKCSPGAAEQCIDGRPGVGYGAGNKAEMNNHGPKVPGGTPAVALAYRVVENPDSVQGETIYNDLGNMVEVYDEVGLSFGAHIDENAGEGFTGCGAIDKMPDILTRLTRPEANPQLKFLVMNMLGKNYEPDRFNKIIGRLTSLENDKETYLDREDGPDGEYRYRETVVGMVKGDADESSSVEKLVGSHSEVGLVVNTLEGTTFNRDKFSSDNHGLIQLFNYDIWRDYELAEHLYPDTDQETPVEQTETYE